MYRIDSITDDDIRNIKTIFTNNRDCIKHCNHKRYYLQYFQIATSLSPSISNLHYEYIIDREGNGYVELHLEGEYLSQKYIRFRKFIRNKTKDNPDLVWLNWMNRDNCRCRFNKRVNNEVDLYKYIKALSSIIDPILVAGMEENPIVVMVVKDYKRPESFVELVESNEEEVSLINCDIKHLFMANLSIPNYQRDYCWEDKQILDLWDSLCGIKDAYHLGTIILHKHDDQYDVIDGQQRLTTLTLILLALGYDRLPLLSQRVSTKLAREHIANAKNLISHLVIQLHMSDLKDRILNNLRFSVLIVNSGNLDLAYTFFSNQNSRGVPLTDYDILKAHHLRYIYSDDQSEHLANIWNGLSHQYTSLDEHEGIFDKVLGTHLYRLRKWKRGYSLETYMPRYVKEEFSAAKIMDSIPPFGERFDFYEKIQGGAHFFEYTEQFVDKYRDFEKIAQVGLLYQYLCGESHILYADVIETLLFDYYLKFGRQYLSEALFCIASIMAQHRYEKSRTNLDKICEYARDSEIVMMIDQSSSPTFFFAEALSNIKVSGGDIEDNNIQRRFHDKLSEMFSYLKDDATEAIKIIDKTIKNKIENEYGRE